MARSKLVGVSRLLFVLFISLLFSRSNSNPTIGGQERRVTKGAAAPTRRQANDTIHVVSGVPRLGIDTKFPRLEVRELERNPDQFNVYLLGLQRFQSISQDEKLSYFQISGIHGRPFVSWDGVEKHPEGKDGYCAHSSNIFPTWHRPYLALMEELLYVNAREVVLGFPDGELKDRMNVALETFRMPYWDAAAVPPEGEGSYPACVQMRTMTVELPDGNTSVKTDIPNPLFSYAFHPLPIDAFKGSDSRFTRWNTTKRFPSNRNADAESQDGKVAYELDANQVNLRQRTYYMLSMQKEYHNFSNNAVNSELSGVVVDSLESVHDSIHHSVGSNGHLTQIAYSAFDPVFWLLHANTDRMFAIWQALNPESYVTNHTNPKATFTTPKNSWADENTPLHPFRCNSAGDFWTSATVRDHTVFGYTYPELIGLSEDVTLIRRVNALYGENATS
ncbi:Di-copper centre-containing protein, partial [Dothidotthia symphoricarpi CBS 119687]